MKYLSYIWFLVFFLIMGCDDNPVVNCAEATAEIVTNEWPGQLEEFNTAIGELDESYTLPDDWKTNCDAYVDAWQTIVDENCTLQGDENPLTQTEIDAFAVLCDANYP